MPDLPQSPEPTDADGMPRPVPSTTDGPMPAPAVPAQPTGTSDEMPRPGGTQAADDTPAGTMPAPGPSSGTADVRDDEVLPRFPSSPGATPSPARYEPGVVEVQFREGVAPQLQQGPDATRVSALGEAVQLDEVNGVLDRYGLIQAEPTFAISVEAATAAHEVAADSGIDAPHLRDFVTLHFPDDADTAAIAAELVALPDVEQAVPVPTALPPTMTVDDLRPAPVVTEPEAAPPAYDPLTGSSSTAVVNPATGLENQWYLFRCRVPDAWSRSIGANVVVADVDWGCRTGHQDLTARITRTHNSYDDTADVTHGGSVFHGTGVAGLAAASWDGKGMAGVAPGAQLWIVQADSGTGTAVGGNAWARGIDWVRQTDSGGRRKVVILEVQTGAFGNYEQVPSVNAAIKTAIAAGVVVCVAAGNGNKDATLDDSGQPIPATGSILVGATGYDAAIDKRAWFSNFGSTVVVAAPGDSDHDVTCDSTSNTAYRNNFGGTSGATPKVAGVAALMLAVNPALSHFDVRSALAATGTALTADPGKPVGRLLNAQAAVNQAAIGAVGRMEVFARGSDKAVWHMWQTAPSNGWSGWASLGGWVDLLNVSRNADGRLEVFARGSDRAVWHRWQTAPNNGWSDWSSLGGWIDRLALGRNADGRLEIFARGSDGALWHRWQTTPNGGWSDWASLGGWIDDLVVGANADGRLEVFARGSDKALWHIWQTAPNGGWSGWASLGGWIDRLAVASNADGRMEVFARGSDAAVWHIWQTAPSNGWSGWASLGGWIDLLSVGRNADGRLEIFARGSDKALWHMWQTAPNNGWSGWASLGGWIDRLALSQNADGRLEAFARGSDAALWHIWQTAPNNGWSGWASLGGWIDLLTVGQNAP